MKNNVNNEISQIRKMMGLKENFEPMVEDIDSGEGVEMPKDKAEEPKQNDDMHEVQMVIMSQLSDLQENGGGDMMKGKINFVKSLVMAFGDGKKEMSGAEIDVMYDKCCGSGMKETPVSENMKMNMGLTMEGEAHGSPYDRGHSDAYYGRERDPHKYPEGTYNGERVTDLTPEEIKAYNAGYDGTSTFKDFGEMSEEDWLLKQRYNKTEGELGEPNFQKNAEGGDGVYENLNEFVDSVRIIDNGFRAMEPIIKGLENLSNAEKFVEAFNKLVNDFIASDEKYVGNSIPTEPEEKKKYVINQIDQRIDGFMFNRGSGSFVRAYTDPYKTNVVRELQKITEKLGLTISNNKLKSFLNRPRV
jgi:hypothetical protein